MEVFVFGSNLAGQHVGGAAKQALQWGARMGVGVGRSEMTYAIPTLDSNFQKLPLEVIKHYLQEFAQYANDYENNDFLLTKIGTGIAGFTEQEMESIMPEFSSNVIRV